MTTQVIKKNGRAAAVIRSSEIVIPDVSSALDFIMGVCSQTGCDRIALNREALCADFFVLSTRLAGEVLQKCVNYQMKLAVYGDFSHYTSKPLRDFIRESNRGRDVFFTATADEAAQRLLAAD